MILSLLLTTLIVPVFAVAGLSYVLQRSLSQQVSLSLIAIVTWLPLYAWIMQWPGFPPKQALDWLWIYVFFSSLSTVLSTIKVRVFSNVKAVMMYQVTLFLTACLVIIWPAISYRASLSSHGLIWLESLFLGLVGAYIVGKVVNHKAGENQTAGMLGSLYLWVVTGALGLIVMMTGSLLIGTLLIALSSAYLAVAVYAKFFGGTKAQPTTNGLPMSYGLILLILLLSRIYVDLDFINTVLVLISIGLSRYLSLKHHLNLAQERWTQFILVICLEMAIGYTVFIEMLNQSNNGYY